MLHPEMGMEKQIIAYESAESPEKKLIVSVLHLYVSLNKIFLIHI